MKLSPGSPGPPKRIVDMTDSTNRSWGYPGKPLTWCFHDFCTIHSPYYYGY